MKPIKTEHKIILDWVAAGASVLDLGCGDGELLALLTNEKQVHAQGIELSETAIQHCVAEGLSVFQQDIDTGLSEYADNSFDYVILNQTLQQVKKPDFALKEALRVGKKPSSDSPTSSKPQRGSKYSSKAESQSPKRCPTSGLTRPTCIF